MRKVMSLRAFTRGAWLALLLTACQDPSLPAGDASECTAAATPVAVVQGDGFVSPLEGQVVKVRGIATLATDQGLFIESAEPDASERTAEGLFLAQPPHAGIVPGTLVVAQGTVRELGEVNDTLTALTDLTQLVMCPGTRVLPRTSLLLPLPTSQREWFEGMRLLLQQELLVTDVYRLREGELQVSAEHILPTPTEVARPGDHAREQARENRERSLYLRLPGPPDEAIPVGAQLTELLGVLGNPGRGPMLLLSAPLNTVPPRLYAIQPPEPADLRIAALNLRNYFNGDGEGGGFPTPRGAQTGQEFTAQRSRIGALVREMQPQLLAVMELENDGFGPLGAVADLRQVLESATGAPWLPVVPEADRIGSDAITTGLLYRPESVEPLGAARVLDAAPFDLLNRPPLAQRFRERTGGAEFWVIVNHFKSKGSCPEQGRDADLRDGQGCWNQARTRAAEALAAWARKLGGESGGQVLLLGDFNAYRMEDPVRTLLQAGFQDLTAPAGLTREYSYVYQGQAGTLDHAFATPELAASVRRAEILHVNAGWPPGMDLPHDWLGASDHDPVLVDLRFRR